MSPGRCLRRNAAGFKAQGNENFSLRAWVFCSEERVTSAHLSLKLEAGLTNPPHMLPCLHKTRSTGHSPPFLAMAHRLLSSLLAANTLAAVGACVVAYIGFLFYQATPSFRNLQAGSIGSVSVLDDVSSLTLLCAWVPALAAALLTLFLRRCTTSAHRSAAKTQPSVLAQVGAPAAGAHSGGL